MPKTFSPTGLPGYTVRCDGLFFYAHNESVGFFERRSTARGAVAACHADHRFRTNLANGIKPAYMIRSDEILAEVAAREATSNVGGR